MYAKISITGTITSVTGMHIGGASGFSAIGAIDSAVIRDVRTNLPMIPGSSLKGKMRSLLQDNTAMVRFPKRSVRMICASAAFSAIWKTRKEKIKKHIRPGFRCLICL